MNERKLYLLSPYRLPTTHQVLLGEEEMAAWLNGFLLLWHPLLLQGAVGLPSVASQYDHDQPTEGSIYVTPGTPELYLPDDWNERVRAAGAVRIIARPQRAETLAELSLAVRDMPPFAGDAFLDLPYEHLQPFFGIGFGYLMVESLFDAMDHEHLLQVEDFRQEVQSAVTALRGGDIAAMDRHLAAAAEKLQQAREILYPIGVHCLDLSLVPEDVSTGTWAKGLTLGLPHNVAANATALERLRERLPEQFAELRERCRPDAAERNVELCGGLRRERGDDLLPLESQLWNLVAGQERTRELLGSSVEVHARRKSAFHPNTPLLLTAAGMTHTLFLSFDSAVIPNWRSTVVQWPAQDGRHVNAFTRMPGPADKVETFFNLVYTLHQSITQDTAPTIALRHTFGQADQPFYADWLALSRLQPVLGTWETFGRFFSDALTGDYVGPASPDDFFADHLEEGINAEQTDPVSRYATQARRRRRLDGIWTIAAMYRSLQTVAWDDAEQADLKRLVATEEAFETAPEATDEIAEQIAARESEWTKRLADRLQAHANDEPGILVLNPCSFTRRLPLELEDVTGPLPLDGPVKAAQFDADKARLVVEVPALGFAWFPTHGKPGTPLPKPRLRMADETTVRNEFFEAEIDTTTGGLRGIRDLRTRMNRLGQQLVFNPGSRMVVKEIKVTANGAALGEVTSEGALLDEQNEILATWRQRYRAWLGRPVLDLRIELFPRHPAQGYPWHAFYGARFAWRDERATLLRGLGGQTAISHHTRPVTPDFLEIRSGRQATTIFPCGLPFHQRHGSRMLDVILMPQRQQANVFDLAIGLDREYPLHTAMGLVSPPVLVRTTKGAPHIGPSGWLLAVDRPNLLLTTLRPVIEPPEERAIVGRFLEAAGYAGAAEIRSVRNPRSAVQLEGLAGVQREAAVTDDAVTVEYAAGEMLRVRIDYP